VPLDATHISRFSNDNLYLQLGATVRYRRVYIVQSLSQPVNDHLMELLMMLDIARSAAASEVHAIIPYYSFGRSDKKDAPRISITARLVADLLKTAGATHVMSMIFHSPQVHGFSVCLQTLEQLAVSRNILQRPENDHGFTRYGQAKSRPGLQKSGAADCRRKQGTHFRFRSKDKWIRDQCGHKCAGL
jgi:ribose-phosphate pyrophosphokinase